LFEIGDVIDLAEVGETFLRPHAKRVYVLQYVCSERAVHVVNLCAVPNRVSFLERYRLEYLYVVAQQRKILKDVDIDRLRARKIKDRLGPFLGEELVRRTRAETTAIGGWLRATQLDEIPQLWNVVRGDMSLVGPRPIRPRFFASLVDELPAYWQRLVVRPGLTGLAQVRRGYETSMAEKLAHDLEWIADRSVRLYLRTLTTTAWRVLGQFARGLSGRSR